MGSHTHTQGVTHTYTRDHTYTVGSHTHIWGREGGVVRIMHTHTHTGVTHTLATCFLTCNMATFVT